MNICKETCPIFNGVCAPDECDIIKERIESIEVFGMETLNLIYYKIKDFRNNYSGKPKFILMNPELYNKIFENGEYQGLKILFSNKVENLEIF